MRHLIFTLAILCGFVAFNGVPQAEAADPADLDAVLKKMDAVAATFKSTQATFEWDTYEKVIDEVDDYETGVISYRRTGKEKEIEMMAEVKMAGSSLQSLKPEPKYVLYSDEKVRMYQPKIDQVTEVDLGKHSDFASYVVLGFGGSGEDLQKVFDVTYAGPETVNGVATAKLQLVPKSEKVRNTYKQILLWIDLDKGISVQQQFFQPDGNYRLAKYTNIQVNGKKIPDEVFKLKTTSKTQTVSPKG
ncbi:MAG TPA: outer membrane lipoprotein carrier protein LolA [Candidatus Binatia bacterium]|jgi:outer membrane lipoprotein-sorting protein|nr:outer membrane lipoprotein carrier protein LolA [Candidatus Binatia bacterium]